MKWKSLLYKMLLAGWLVFGGAEGFEMYADNLKVTSDTLKRRIERKDTIALRKFFRKMPKGGDIHTHLTGAVTPELYWRLAKQKNWKVDTITGKLYAPSTTERGIVLLNEGFKKKIFSCWSVEGWKGRNQRDSAKHFFDAFGLTGDLADEHTVDLLRALKDSVVNDHIQYLELMAVSPKVSPELNQIGSKINLSVGDFSTQLNNLLRDHVYTDSVKKWAENYKKVIWKIDRDSRTDKNKDLICRYQGYTNRNNKDLLKMFTQLWVSFEACKQDSLVVGVNIVSEESAGTALDNYDKHMRMFQVLKKRYRDTAKISLHAGELVESVLPQGRNDFYNHIDSAVRVAYADRIGHGIDINQKYKGTDFEKNVNALCAGMLQKDFSVGGKKVRSDTVVVEVNLTSNDFILGVRGSRHCLQKYKEKGVPFVIATDDQGILCTNLTEQYVKLALEHKLTYEEIKKIVYNSIRYSFASPGMKGKLKKDLDRKFAAFEGYRTK